MANNYSVSDFSISRYYSPWYYVRRSRGVVAVICAALAAWIVLSSTGCTRKTETANSSDSSVTSMDSSSNTSATPTPPAPAPSSTAPAPPAPMSDANIIAALREADSAEITEAKLVISKSKNADVKAFANMMIADHMKMMNEKADLAKKLNITPQPPANDQTPSEMSDMMNTLNSASSPSAMDSLYVANAVTDHQNDLNEVRNLETKATAPQLQDALKKAEPVIQKHLDHANMLQEKMTKSGSPMSGKTMHGKTMEKK